MFSVNIGLAVAIVALWRCDGVCFLRNIKGFPLTRIGLCRAHFHSKKSNCGCLGYILSTHTADWDRRKYDAPTKFHPRGMSYGYRIRIY